MADKVITQRPVTLPDLIHVVLIPGDRVIQATYRVPIEGMEQPIQRVTAIEVDAPGNEDLADMTDAWLKRLVVEANEAEGTALDAGEVARLEEAIVDGRIERGRHHEKDEVVGAQPRGRR